MQLANVGSRPVALVAALTLALLVTPGLLLAQDAGSSDPAEAAQAEAKPAQVRFLHGAQAGGMDLFVGDELAVKGLEFGQLSDYVDVPAGKQPLEALATEITLEEGRASKGDQNHPSGYTDITANLKPGSTSTIVLAADGAGFNEIWTIKDKAKPKSGKSQVRVVGICSNCGPIDLALDKARKPLVKDLHYLEDVESKYVSVKPGELDLQLRLTGQKKAAKDFDPVTVLPGSSNTLYAVGWLIDDSMTLVPALDAALTKVRVANAAIEPHRADVYVDGKKIAKGVLQEQASAFRFLRSGEHLVQVVEAGVSPADGTLSEGTVTLQPGAVEAIVVGQADPIYVAPVPNDPTRKAKQSRMRFANISAAAPSLDIWIDGELIAEDLAFGESTPYVSGTGEIQVDLPDGSSWPIGSMDFMAPRESYSGYIAGAPEDGDFTLMIVGDRTPKK